MYLADEGDDSEEARTLRPLHRGSWFTELPSVLGQVRGRPWSGYAATSPAQCACDGRSYGSGGLATRCVPVVTMQRNTLK
jgi:hypothetical protein